MKSQFSGFTDYNGQVLTAEDLLTKIQNLAFCLTDEKGFFREVNSMYSELYGYSEEELIGNHFTMVLPEEYRSYAARVHDEFIAGNPEMPAEWTVQDKLGNQMRIKAEAIRCTTSGGTTSKMTLIERIDS